jgi:hypothetical protein
MLATKNWMTGWKEAACFFAIFSKIDLATLKLDSDLGVNQ